MIVTRLPMFTRTALMPRWSSPFVPLLISHRENQQDSSFYSKLVRPFLRILLQDFEILDSYFHATNGSKSGPKEPSDLQPKPKPSIAHCHGYGVRQCQKHCGCNWPDNKSTSFLLLKMEILLTVNIYFKKELLVKLLKWGDFFPPGAENRWTHCIM